MKPKSFISNKKKFRMTKGIKDFQILTKLSFFLFHSKQGRSSHTKLSHRFCRSADVRFEILDAASRPFGDLPMTSQKYIYVNIKCNLKPKSLTLKRNKLYWAGNFKAIITNLDKHFQLSSHP